MKKRKKKLKFKVGPELVLFMSKGHRFNDLKKEKSKYKCRKSRHD
jgi:hypothetical protein